MASHEDQNHCSSPTGSLNTIRGHKKSRSADETESKLGKKRTFRFAHPPPINKQQQIFKLRPRVLLQLHLVADGARTSPTLDVLPSSIFPSGLPFKFAKLFRGKAGLGPRDLVVINRDGQDRPTSLTGEENLSNADENWDQNRIMATVCHVRKLSSSLGSGTDITFSHGQSWKGVQLANGSYEFISTGDDGTITRARWVLRRKLHQRSASSQEVRQSVGESLAKRFSFSLIDPTRRRHAVIASMTRECISVSDRYQPVVDAMFSGGRLGQSDENPSSSHSTSPIDGSQFDDNDSVEIPTQRWIETDDKLRTLIMVTAIWVMFKEGWSRNFSFEDVVASTGISRSVSAGNKSSRHGDIKSQHISTRVSGTLVEPRHPRRSASLALKRPSTFKRMSTDNRSISARWDTTQSKGATHDMTLSQKSSSPAAVANNEALSPATEQMTSAGEKEGNFSQTRQRKDPFYTDEKANYKVSNSTTKASSHYRCRQRWRKFRGVFAFVR